MQKPLEDVIAEVRGTVAFLEALTGVELPKNIHAAMEGDVMQLINDLGEGVMSHVPKDDLRRMEGKVIPLERANNLLVILEEGLIKTFCAPHRGTFVAGLEGIKNRYKFLITKLPQMIAVMLPTLAAAGQQILEALASQGVVAATNMTNAIGRYFGVPDENQLDERDARRDAQLLREAVAELPGQCIQAMLSNAAAFIVADIVAGIGTKVQYQKAIKPASLALRLTTQVAESVALPQRNGPRFRRRKRTDR